MLRACRFLLQGRKPSGAMLGTIRSRRSWSLPDIRQPQKGAKSMHRLESIMLATQYHGDDGGSAIDYRGGRPIHGEGGGYTYQAEAQSALLSRPGGRRTRLDANGAGTFHYQNAQKRRKPRFDTRQFRKHYNSS